MHDDSSTIKAAVDNILSSLCAVPDLNRLSPSKKRMFSYDLAFVALAVRTGYLIDLILPEDPVSVFATLLRILRQTSALFGDVIHIFDPASQQSFLVNGILLQKRLHRLMDVQFVQLLNEEACQLLEDVPSGIQEALCRLAPHLDMQDVPLSVPLCLHDPTSIVSLAAVLIEYPMAYVISPAVASFLHHVRLDVYECVVEYNSHIHILLKFSCPAILGEKYPDKLSPRQIRADLQCHFGGESRLGRWEDATLQVLYHTEMHDRVAL